MKKSTKIFIAVGVILYVALGVFLILSGDKAERAGGPFALPVVKTNNDATSTVSYLNTTDTASTTLTFKSEGAESIDLNLLFTASSTNSIVMWSYEFSNDQNEWYAEDGYTNTSNLITTHGGTPLIHQATYASTTGASKFLRKNITITPTASRYVRINFGVTGDNGALYAEVVLKRPY